MTNVPEVLRMRNFRVEELVWETSEIFTLRLAPVEEETSLPFKAGQWVYLHLLNEDGSSWGKAAFSIATAPSDTCLLELGIKIARDFTKRASQLSVGSIVNLQGPFGVFTLPADTATPLIFIAGGIGVTPLRSMIRELIAQKSATPIYLVYSNRYLKEAAYLEECRALEKANPNIKIILTLTGDQPEAWPGNFGRVDENMLAPVLGEVGQNGRFYMCGPNPFMDAIRQVLEKAGVDKKRIHQERFD